MNESLEYKLEGISQIAEQLLKSANEIKIFLLTGDLGAGKTTLVTEMCKQLGVIEQISSPTYSIVNEYMTEVGSSIYHLDLYRLEDEDEAMNIGIEEYLYSSNYIFIEWPEIIERLLPENILRIHIQNIDDSTRKILFL